MTDEARAAIIATLGTLYIESLGSIPPTEATFAHAAALHPEWGQFMQVANSDDVTLMQARIAAAQVLMGGVQSELDRAVLRAADTWVRVTNRAPISTDALATLSASHPQLVREMGAASEHALELYRRTIDEAVRPLR